jgi:hypothetical protein
MSRSLAEFWLQPTRELLVCCIERIGASLRFSSAQKNRDVLRH